MNHIHPLYSLCGLVVAVGSLVALLVFDRKEDRRAWQKASRLASLEVFGTEFPPGSDIQLIPDPDIATSLLMAAASSAASAAASMIEVARDGEIAPGDDVGSGESTALLADALRLVLYAQADGRSLDEEENQLHGALVRYLESSL